MLNDIKAIIHRSQATLVGDAVAVISLFMLLFAGLTLSGTA